jgi:hypothetical protein
MTAPAFIYTSEPWAALSFGRPIFAPAFTRDRMSAGHLPSSPELCKSSAMVILPGCLGRCCGRKSLFLGAVPLETGAALGAGKMVYLVAPCSLEQAVATIVEAQAGERARAAPMRKG